MIYESNFKINAKNISDYTYNRSTYINSFIKTELNKVGLEFNLINTEINQVNKVSVRVFNPNYSKEELDIIFNDIIFLLKQEIRSN